MDGIDWVVVPSIWWETGPIVVMEAFQYGRPVICSDIGGMSEKVTDGVNGLHFRRRDPEQLADVMQRAAETPGLWDELRAGIPADPPRWMDDHVTILSDLYRRLLAERGALDDCGPRPRRSRGCLRPDRDGVACHVGAAGRSGRARDLAEPELPAARRRSRRQPRADTTS